MKTKLSVRLQLPLMTLALILGILLGRSLSSWVWPAIGCALALLACIPAGGPPRRAALVVLALCAGSWSGQAAWHPALPPEGTAIVSGVVSDEIRVDGIHVRTILRSVTVNGEPSSSGAYWTFYTDEVPEGLVPGCRVTAQMRVYHPQAADNPGGYDFREYLLQKGITFGVYGIDELTVSSGGMDLWGLAAHTRHALSEGLIRVMGETSGGYASAMLLGTRDLVPQDDREAFNRLGIGHILSISGFHVAVLFFLLSGLMRLFRAPRWLRLALLTVTLAAYALLTGLNPPVIRASVLLMLSEYAAVRHRQGTGIYLLCLTAMATLLISPAQLTGASFQLSYGAMLGLTLVRPYLLKRVRPVRRAAKQLWNAFASALSVQIGILLPMLYWYHELPLLGLFLNVFVLSLAQVQLVLYWCVLVLMGVPGAGPAAGRLADWFTQALTAAVRWVSGADFLTLWTRQAGPVTFVGWVVLLAALACVLPLKRRTRRIGVLAGCVLLAVSVVPLPHHGTEYIQFSVGNADAAVIWDGDQVTVIDAGEDSTISEWLHQRRLSVDRLVLTHLHSDHAAGVQSLLDDRIPVREVFLPYGAEEAAVAEDMLALVGRVRAAGIPVRPLARGDRLAFPSGAADVIWPENGRVRPGQDANDSCLVLRLTLRGTSLLMTGDLSGTYEPYCAVPSDILKVPHHGSKNSSTEAFLRDVDPRLMLVSGQADSRLEALIARSPAVPILSTGEGGALIVRFGDGVYTAVSFMNGPIHTGKEEAALGETDPADPSGLSEAH